MEVPATPADAAPTQLTGGYPVWRAASDAVEIRFVGRGPDRSREQALAAVEAAAPAVAALRQVHSTRVVRVASAGFHGEGDALVTDEPGLALSVITADCVPLLLAAGDVLLAVHAGWRGIAAGVIPAALATLATHQGPARAWLGPAIGPCCYEVSDEVAAQVVAASSPAVARQGSRGRPHLDLRLAARTQLATGGVGQVSTVGPCTRCHPDLLWSYRREGRGAGRNLAFVWRR